MLFRIFKKWFCRKCFLESSELLKHVQEFQRREKSAIWLVENTYHYFENYEKGSHDKDEELLELAYRTKTYQNRERPDYVLVEDIFEYWNFSIEMSRKKRALNNDPLRFC